MASGGSWHLYDIPNPIMESLYKIMDRTQKWKILAGQYLDRPQADIQYLEYRENHGVSPSREILQEWSLEDPSVDQLFVILSKMRFYPAMKLLRDYASPHLHQLLDGEGSRKSVLDAITGGSRAKQKPGGSVPAQQQQPHQEQQQQQYRQQQQQQSQQQTAEAGSALMAFTSTDGMGATSMPVLNFNLNQSYTKEMMSTKLRPDEVARLMDSKFGTKMEVSGSSNTLNNISRPGAALASPQLRPSTQFGAATPPAPATQLSAAAQPAPEAQLSPSNRQQNGQSVRPCRDTTAATAGAVSGATSTSASASTAKSVAVPAATVPAAAAAGPAAAAPAAASDTTTPPVGAAAAPSSAPTAADKSANGNAGPDETDVKRKYSQDVHSYMDRLGNIPQISYKELEAGTDGWSQHRVLGSGGFGTVYRGTWKNTVWAIKRITQRDSGRTEAELQEQMQQTLEELRILNSCRHDNVLPLCGYSIFGPEPLLLYQFMDNGSLLDRIMCKRGSRPLTWLQRHNVARGTARGLQFLHTRGTTPLIHGDIKSANILLDHHLEPKIGDFGLAREFPQTRHTSLTVTRVHGTRPYLPDEYLRSRRLSEKVDTYSFGVVLFELTTGLPAYDDKRQIKMLKTLVEDTVEKAALMDRKGGSADIDIFPALLRVGELCVSRRSKDRPEMVRVLSELDSITQARNLAARAQRISIEEAPSVEMSPLELQVLMDRRQQDYRPAASPRPSFQLPSSVSPGPSAFSATTAPPPYSEVVGSPYHHFSPAPTVWPAAGSRPSAHSPQWFNVAHSPQTPQLQAALSPQTPQFQMSPQTPQFQMSPQTPQFQMAQAPQFQTAHSPQAPQFQMAHALQFPMAHSPQPPQYQSTHPSQPRPVPGRPPPQQHWGGDGEPPSALPTVLPHVLQQSSSELSSAGSELALGPAPLLTALGLKSGSEPSAVSLGDSQLSTGGSYTSDVTETE